MANYGDYLFGLPETANPACNIYPRML